MAPSLRTLRPGLAWLLLGLLPGCLADTPQAPYRTSTGTVTYTPIPGPTERAAGAQGAAVSGPMLTVPVAGVRPEQVQDSFHAARSGGRVHEATDILAPRGTPVLSADDGLLVKIGQNRYGGNVLYATDTDGRFVYYYAHLDGFAPGLAAGQPLRRGMLLGFVGTTGNAPPQTPHLHFQLMLRPASGSLHGGQPVDARPFFVFPGTESVPPAQQPVAALP